MVLPFCVVGCERVSMYRERERERGEGDGAKPAAGPPAPPGIPVVHECAFSKRRTTSGEQRMAQFSE